MKSTCVQSVKAIRHGKVSEDKEPIIYYWWFKLPAARKILKKLDEYISWQNLCDLTINGQKYVLLYIGKGKNGQVRLADYHILDKNNFHKSGVKNRRISSLRASICGLLDIQMSTGKKSVDRFIDDNCMVDWTIEKGDLKNAEKKLIQSMCLPLNDHYLASNFAKEHRKILRDSKRNMRK